MDILAIRQIALIPWNKLRSGSGYSAQVGVDLEMLLFAGVEDDDGSCERLENEVEAQGHLFECAPAVVSVIASAVAQGVIPESNLAPSLDLLGRVLAGYSDDSEISLGVADLRERCYFEAIKCYWSLLEIASKKDVFGAWENAVAIVEMLDEKHSRAILGP